MESRSLSSPGKPVRTRGQKIAAWIFALLGLTALGISAYYGRQRYLRENPPPIEGVIPPIPENQQEALRTGMSMVGKTILRLSPEQEQQVNDIWKTTPRSLDEVIEMQRKTDKILTADQRARLKPLRQAFQNRIIDQMLEPARDRFPESEFEKLRSEVKNRVEDRITGQ